MKIALVDDEQTCLDEISCICEKFAKEHMLDIEIAAFTNGEHFLEALEENDYSIVFMDIYMEKVGGISAALTLREKSSNCILIFLTSSREHMPDAFSCHAFDYITKPFLEQRVNNVLSDALKVLPNPEKYIEIYSSREKIRILFNNLCFVTTNAHYLEFGLVGKTMLRSRMTMSEFLQCIGEEPRFITVNKGIVVNADYVFDFQDNCCIMEDGTKFPIRVRDCLKIEQALREYHFEKIRKKQQCRR